MNHEAEPDPSVLMETAARQVSKLTKAVDRYRLFTVILGAVCVALIAGGITLGIVAYRSSQLVNTVRDGAISSCESGNLARATNQKIWDEFLNILVDNPATAQERMALEKAISAASLPPATARLWDTELNLEFTPSSSAKKIVSQFEAYIAAKEKQQACRQIYGASLVIPSPAAGPIHRS